MKVWFRKKQSSTAIQAYRYSNTTNKYAEEIKKSLDSIDEKILRITQDLIQVESARFRSYLNSQNSLIGNLQRKFYSDSFKSSASWHRERLILLRKERAELQVEWEKATGTFWANRIKRWILFLGIIALGIFVLWIIFMGLITALYLLPIWCGFLLIYWLVKRRKNNFF